MRTIVSWQTQTGMKVRRPQSQALAPQCPWFALPASGDPAQSQAQAYNASYTSMITRLVRYSPKRASSWRLTMGKVSMM
jgi:hypothetical protein